MMSILQIHKTLFPVISAYIFLCLTTVSMSNIWHEIPDIDEEEVRLLAEVIYHENWNTDKNHRAAYLTGAVVRNRMFRDEEWLHLKGECTVYDVVYARGQYSTTKKFFTKEIPQECYDMARDILIHGTPDVPENVIYQATFKQGKTYEIINGEYFCYG